MQPSRDPFKESRRASGVQVMQAEGRAFPLILRHADVKQVCRDWKTFSSDDPFMIVPHSEAQVRTVRQLPIEIDPPVQRTSPPQRAWPALVEKVERVEVLEAVPQVERESSFERQVGYERQVGSERLVVRLLGRG